MNVDQLFDVYRTMLVSRHFDERCMKILGRGDAIPHYHSGVGQEALMVASVAPLRNDDHIIYTHRGYGHLLAKGIPLSDIVLDLFMKVGGTNEGFGGVMHVNRPEIGVLGREGAFGTRFGIAIGVALAAKLRDLDQVTVCFYGEAAGARGPLYEALNMAVLWKLPVVFVAENNGWSFSSRTEWLFPEGRMSRVWRGFDIPVIELDGNDAEAIWAGVTPLVERARGGEGPAVVEALTYRLDPHIWWDDAAYQPSDEVEAWRQRDPLQLTRVRLTALGVQGDNLDEADAEARAEVDEAFARSDVAPAATWPKGSE